jgi:uncharacterized protein (DUF342 family)
MSKKTEPEKVEIKSFDDLQDALKPFIERVNEAKKRIKNFQDSLGVYEVRYETCERKLTELLKKAEDLIGQGQPMKLNDAIFAGKAEKKDLEQWISQLGDSILQGQAALETVQKELDGKFFEGVASLRIVEMEKVNHLFSQIKTEWTGYTSQVRDLASKLGIKIPSYSHDSLYYTRIGEELFLGPK